MKVGDTYNISDFSAILNLAADEIAKNDGKVSDEILEQFASITENLLQFDETPTLEDAFSSVNTEKLSWLSTDALLEMLGIKNKQDSIESSQAQLDVNAASRKAKNEERINELTTQINKLEEQNKLSGFMKIFNKIAAVFTLIGAAITVALAVAFPNPLTIAGAVLTCVCAVDAALSAFSDGKYSISVGVAKIAEAAGAKSDVAQYIGMAFTLALNITAAGLSAGGAYKAVSAIQSGISKAITAVEKGVDVAENLTKIQNLSQQFGNAVNAINKTTRIASGINAAVELGIQSAQIGIGYKSTEINADITESQAQVQLISSILAKLDAVDEKEIERIKELMQAGNTLSDGIEQVLESQVDALQSASGAQMA